MLEMSVTLVFPATIVSAQLAGSTSKFEEFPLPLHAGAGSFYMATAQGQKFHLSNVVTRQL